MTDDLSTKARQVAEWVRTWQGTESWVVWPDGSENWADLLDQLIDLAAILSKREGISSV